MERQTNNQLKGEKRKVDEQDIHDRHNTNFRMTQQAGTRLGDSRGVTPSE